MLNIAIHDSSRSTLILIHIDNEDILIRNLGSEILAKIEYDYENWLQDFQRKT